MATGETPSAWAEEMRAFYTAHVGEEGGLRATKIAQIPAIVESYAGAEVELMAMLYEK